jgi:chromosome segregation ATPase
MSSATWGAQEAQREMARKEQMTAKEAEWKTREAAMEAEMREKEGLIERMAKELEELKTNLVTEDSSQIGSSSRRARINQFGREGQAEREANPGDRASIKEVVGAELAPLAQLVSRLTERVEELSRGSSRGGGGGRWQDK